MILCDTDIMIEALKSDVDAIGVLQGIGSANIALSAITVMELYFGALNKQELSLIKNRLAKLEIIQVNNHISEVATHLIEKYAKSHSLHIPDALIASTAICRRMPLLTRNVKDFQYLEGIHLYQQ